ncbi:crAss001_48 related protein [Aureimonas sp. AU40]|uniref:crAss001_48 related protein n=1 Tax=Aureimonas sp. AU40 TaxID=1637747 RepID=UPI00078582B5|nr:hypothetical protein [Aureimonas sp. AU40]
MTTLKPVVIGRHTLACNTDAYILSRRPEVAAALGIPDRQVQVVLHDLLFHMQRHRHPEEITFPVHAGDASGAKVKFRIHASPSFYTISRDDDVVRVFGKSSAGASQSAPPAVQVSGAGVSISVSGISVDRLRAVADLLQFGTSPAEPQLHEGESAAIEQAALTKDQAAARAASGVTILDYAPDYVPPVPTPKDGLTDAEKAQLENGGETREVLWKRLDAEALELDKRLFDLAAFVKSADYRRLADIDRDLLVSQEAAMRTYLRVLETRRRRVGQNFGAEPTITFR